MRHSTVLSLAGGVECVHAQKAMLILQLFTTRGNNLLVAM